MQGRVDEKYQEYKGYGVWRQFGEESYKWRVAGEGATFRGEWKRT